MTEAQIQAQLISWWKLAHRGLGVPDARLLYMVPNGAYFGAGANSKGVSLAAIRFMNLKRQGFVQGVPDLKLAVQRGPFGGLYVEMKKSGGRLSPEQREMHALLEAQGYAVAVAHGLDEAVEAVTGYLLSK